MNRYPFQTEFTYKAFRWDCDFLLHQPNPVLGAESQDLRQDDFARIELYAYT